jgi:hypothetical protein
VFASPGRKNADSYFSEPRHAIERLMTIGGPKHSVHNLRRMFDSATTRLVPHSIPKVLAMPRTIFL